MVGLLDKCKLDESSKATKDNNYGKVKPIKIIELSSAFLILGAGLTLGTLVFLVERFVAPQIYSKRG